MPDDRTPQPRPASDAHTEAEASARFAADLYYFVARRVIKDLGEPGERAVRRGLREFGLARGAAIRAAAEAAGEAPGLASFLKHYDLPGGHAWQAESTVTPTRKEAAITYCPFAQAWRARGGAEVGQIYCEEVDPAIREGFGPEVRFAAHSYTLRGGGPCRQSDEARR